MRLDGDGRNLLHRPGEADAARVGISGKGAVIMAAALTEPEAVSAMETWND